MVEGSNPIIDKFYGKGYQGSLAPSRNAAGIEMNVHIEVPFHTVMDKLVSQVKSGVISQEVYYAILDNYQKVLDKYRSMSP